MLSALCLTFFCLCFSLKDCMQDFCLRLYSHPSKRESAASETTTTTLLVPRMSLAPHYDGRHLHADYITSGSASGEQSPV
ncbi:unnamed protein product, partial [Brenthis ino]